MATRDRRDAKGGTREMDMGEESEEYELQLSWVGCVGVVGEKVDVDVNNVGGGGRSRGSDRCPSTINFLALYR